MWILRELILLITMLHYDKIYRFNFENNYKFARGHSFLSVARKM